MNQKQTESDRTAFLLSQVGGRAAQEFTRLLQPLGLAPADAGILRLVSRSDGISQQALAGTLSMHASRLVGLIDDLESRGLLVRKVHPSDRRRHSLSVTEEGKETLLSIRKAAEEHNRLMCAALTRPEAEMLHTLLSKIAQQQGLTARVHPGYRGVSAETTVKKRVAPAKAAAKKSTGRPRNTKHSVIASS